MIRRLVLLFLAAAVVVASPAAARALDDPGLVFYEKQARDVLKAAGEKIWGAADDAKRQAFFEFAQEQAERALEFDPDQADARKFLAYDRKDGKWVQDAEAYAKVPKQNSHANTESQENFDKRMKKWQDDVLAKANKFVAAKYAELGEMCVAKGYADQASKAFEASMHLDKENERARKGLGYTKFGKTWLTKKQDDARKSASKSNVVAEKEPSEWENFFGIKLNKVESQHVRIESPFPVDELMLHCQAAETAYAYYLADFGKDPGMDVFDGRKATWVLMDKEDQWNKFVDAFGGSEKEFTRQLTGCSDGRFTEEMRGGKPPVKQGDKTEIGGGSTPEGRRDQLVHQMIHLLNQQIWRLSSTDRAWLDEGLAYYYTLKVLESCLTHCVAIVRGDYANGHKDDGGIKKWDDPNGWKPLLKDMVKKKDDMPLRSLVSLPLTKLEFQATVKAWGVATYLMDLDRDKFTSCLEQMLDKAVKQDNVLQGTYGKGLEELDDDWHAYVKKCY